MRILSLLGGIALVTHLHVFQESTSTYLLFLLGLLELTLELFCLRYHNTIELLQCILVVVKGHRRVEPLHHRLLAVLVSVRRWSTVGALWLVDGISVLVERRHVLGVGQGRWLHVGSRVGPGHATILAVDHRLVVAWRRHVSTRTLLVVYLGRLARHLLTLVGVGATVGTTQAHTSSNVRRSPII